jgi:predicted permease
MVTIVAALLFGLVPALRATRVDVATALRGQGRGPAAAGVRIGRVAVGSVLVVGQVALSTLLLIGTGLLLRSMTHILTVDLGLDRDHLVSLKVSPRRGDYDGQHAALLLRELTERVQRVPGVRAVGSSSHGIFTGGEGESEVRVPGFVPQADSELSVKASEVGPGFFRAIGAHVVTGREFDAHDSERSARVAVINETMARHYFSSANPVGRTLRQNDSAYTIIGVVRDVEEQDVRAKPVRRLYTSIAQATEALRVFVLEVRVNGSPSQYVEPLRASLSDVNSKLSLEIDPLNDLVRDSVSQDLLVTRVTTFFGLLGLVLAALGLYGVTTYTTSRRTAEFGLRAALGAEPIELARMVLAESVRLVAIGVAIGVPAGLVATRFVRSQIFGVSAIDIPSLSAAVTVLLATALVASYLPARRAARVGPLGALRSD